MKCMLYNPQLFPRRPILDSSVLKEFADDNFLFNKKGREFSYRVESTGKKKKMLIMSNFPLFHSVCKRLVLQTCKIPGLVWEGSPADCKQLADIT